MNKQLIEKLLLNLLDNKEDQTSQYNQEAPWHVGKSYFIRTVTMHLVGKLVSINDKEILLEQASWVADSGRFHNALKSGVLDEVEPFVNDVIVNRNSVIDATVWDHALPIEAK